MKSLDRTLELFAGVQPTSPLVNGAQQRLEQAITAATPRRRPANRVGWLAAAASACLAVFVALWLPLNSTAALAFSDVQEHLRDFRTLRFEMTQQVAGQEGSRTRVSLDRDGSVRTDIGEDLSVILNSGEHRVLTLVHRERLAVEHPLGSEVGEVDATDWLEDIRDFQGMATQLPAPRVIDGKTAYGWQLRIQNLDVVLWATAEGLPLEMHMNGGAEMRFDFHFEFDVALAPETFSTVIPPGYSRAEAED